MILSRVSSAAVRAAASGARRLISGVRSTASGMTWVRSNKSQSASSSTSLTPILRATPLARRASSSYHAIVRRVYAEPSRCDALLVQLLHAADGRRSSSSRLALLVALSRRIAVRTPCVTSPGVPKVHVPPRCSSALDAIVRAPGTAVRSVDIFTMLVVALDVFEVDGGRDPKMKKPGKSRNVYYGYGTHAHPLTGSLEILCSLGHDPLSAGLASRKRRKKLKLLYPVQ